MLKHFPPVVYKNNILFKFYHSVQHNYNSKKKKKLMPFQRQHEQIKSAERSKVKKGGKGETKGQRETAEMQYQKIKLQENYQTALIQTFQVPLILVLQLEDSPYPPSLPLELMTALCLSECIPKETTCISSLLSLIKMNSTSTSTGQPGNQDHIRMPPMWTTKLPTEGEPILRTRVQYQCGQPPGYPTISQEEQGHNPPSYLIFSFPFSYLTPDQFSFSLT